MLLLTTFTGFAFPPPDIVPPSPLQTCDDNGDGMAVFDLTTVIPQVMGALNPNLYTLTFHDSFSDANIGMSPIIVPTSFFGNHGQVLYIRVEEDAEPTNFNITVLELRVNALPTPIQPMDLTVEDIPFDGIATFDLTLNSPLMINGSAGAFVTYYHTLTDAQAGVSSIASPSAYIGTDGEMIWARVDETTGCYAIRSFALYVTNPDFVFIPDANFKAKLIAADGTNQIAQDLAHNYTVVDSNGDGQIQYSEAANISYLNVSQAGIADLTGLEAFMNVTVLNAGYNAPLTAIPTTALPLLTDLSTPHCGLTSLDLSNNPNLASINCEYNSLDSLDFSACPLMMFIHCQNNGMASLNVTGLTSLVDLWASNNVLTSINTADLNSIERIIIGANFLTSLDLTGLSTLTELQCEENNIDSLDTAGCPNLAVLSCGANLMTYLDVSQSLQLATLDCSQNTLVNLDLGSNTALCSLNCSANNDLVTLNIKNGVDSCYTNFNVLFITNSLQQFCCDDNEVAYFKNYFLTQQGIDVNVNSYCSFIPGGNYNTITASSQYDGNNNGCDINDNSFPNIRFNIFDGTNGGAAFTGVSGSAAFYTQAGSFDITPAIENPTFFIISPPTMTIPFSNTNNNTAAANFCIAPNGLQPDLEVVLVPIVPARPGFDAQYEIVYRNKGNMVLSGGLAFTYNDDVMNFLSSDMAPDNQSAGLLNYGFINISPFESRSILITMHINPPTDLSHPVNIGDILNFTATINSPDGDQLPSDNTFQFNQTVVGSFDPNEIVCLEGNIVSPIEIGNYLHYTINFENTGTADAENIVVREIINTAQFDLSSLQLLDSSASVTTRLIGNTAEFIFPGINLHSGGHGNILLKIRSNNTLVAGDMVSKTANIYFDYNFPVETAPENTVFQALNNPDVGADASISVYPNPTKGAINISCNNSIRSVQLYDVQGRLLQTSLVGANQATLDVSHQSNGVYFLKIISDKGMLVKKMVRE
jgi:hypothetical protein